MSFFFSSLSDTFHPNQPVVTHTNHLKQSYHAPKSPKYKNLLQMIKPIIPHAFHDAPRTTEEPNIEVIRSVLNTTKDIVQKVYDPKQKSKLNKVIKKGRRLLDSLHSTGGRGGLRSAVKYNIPDEKRDELLKDFAKALKPTQQEFQGKAKAPFSRLGEDGFEDVDHQILAMEIKRLALTLRNYIQMRMEESIEYTRAGENLDAPSIKAKYFTDSILTQMTLEMAKLHRAVLRNHHHILMVIGNFAGNAASSDVHEHVNNTSITDDIGILNEEEK